MFTSWKYLKGLFSEKRTTRTCFSTPTLFNLELYLGHASPESTRLYTEVSDETVIMEYRQAIGEEPHQ